MSDLSGEPRRARSAALFNNRHFADVAAAALVVSSDGTAMFTARMVASSTGLADSVVRPVLHRLVDAKVLNMLPKSGGGRSAQYYLVLQERALETVRDLASADDANQSASVRDRARPDSPD